jgi:hypothetical protein
MRKIKMQKNKFMKSGKFRIIFISLALIISFICLLYISFGITSSGSTQVTVYDSTPPNVSLIYPANNSNITWVEAFMIYFNVSDTQWANISNCSVYLNDTLNQTKYNLNYSNENLTRFDNITQNFTLNNLTEGTYQWFVNCTEFRNSSYDNTTIPRAGKSEVWTFSIEAIPAAPDEINISLIGDFIDLNWTEGDKATTYKVYSTDDLSSAFELYNQTTERNVTKLNVSNVTAKYYKIAAVSSFGENTSGSIVGKKQYQLQRVAGSNTRNWVAFPLNITRLMNASYLINTMTNVTSITQWNVTTQAGVTCNNLSCPNTDCTETNCNFAIEPGYMYEVNIGGSSALMTNWTTAGEVIEATSVDLYQIGGTFSRNWISLPANTTLSDAQDVIDSMSTVTQVRQWDESSQSTQARINFRGGIGQNFNIDPYKGYEVLASTNFTWNQE